MDEVLSYCGYRCDCCPAFHKNLKSQQDRVRVSQDWTRYYNHHADPDEVACDGCLEGPLAPNPGCKVRPCAIERCVENCAVCDDFACDKITKQMAAIRPIADKHAQSMPREDYERYIAPFESEERLKGLRGSR